MKIKLRLKYECEVTRTDDERLYNEFVLGNDLEKERYMEKLTYDLNDALIKGVPCHVAGKITDIDYEVEKRR